MDGESRELDLSEADVYADWRDALGINDLLSEDEEGWKSVEEISREFGLSRKVAYERARAAVDQGRMERKWQYRETGEGARRMTVYRVVDGD